MDEKLNIRFYGCFWDVYTTMLSEKNNGTSDFLTSSWRSWCMGHIINAVSKQLFVLLFYQKTVI